jgi:hypothetical protein
MKAKPVIPPSVPPSVPSSAHPSAHPSVQPSAHPKPVHIGIISQHDFNNLKKMLESKTTEIEIGFGRFSSSNQGIRFSPGVSSEEFDNAFECLSKSEGVDISSSYETVSIDSSTSTRRIKDEISKSTYWQVKSRFRGNKIENGSWGYRISESEEGEIINKEPKGFKPSFERTRRRYTFTYPSNSHKFHKIRFDLTQVNEKNLVNGKEEIKNEIEIERLLPDLEASVFVEAIESMLMCYQGVSKVENLITEDEKQYVFRLHNRLFESEIAKLKYKPRDMYRDYWNKPENLKKDDLISPYNSYQITVKLDGIRRFLLFDAANIYACNPPLGVKKLNLSFPELSGTLLDAEEYEDIYNVFDILFFKGRDVRTENLETRLSYIKDTVVGKFPRKIELKKFYDGSGDFYKAVKEAFNEYDKSKRKVDGLIFQPFTTYREKNVPHARKWKPSSLLTIDFKLGSTQTHNIYTLNVIDKGKIVPFMGSKINPTDIHTVEIKSSQLGPGYLFVDGLIVECRWNYEKTIFEVLRVRNDRGGFPNGVRTADDIWNDILDPFSKDTLEGKDLLLMRRFHNLVKAQFLQDTLKKGDTIMDWGSGRGGDLSKWAKLQLQKIFIVEPNKENLSILQERHNQMKTQKYAPEIRSDPKPSGFEIEICKTKTGGLCGGQDTRELKKMVGDEKLNAIVSFFSLTFFAQDPKIYDKMIKTISELSPEKFIGIVMDGGRVSNFLGSKEKVTNTAFEIKKVTKDIGDEELGNEIEIKIFEESSMVDQTEWLFYFEMFRNKMAKIGYKVSYHGFLDSESRILLKSWSYDRNLVTTSQVYEKLPTHGKEFSRLNHYFVFEKYELDQITKFHDDRVLISVIPDESSFLHAIIRAVDNKYKTSDVEYRVNFTNKCRRIFGRKLTNDFFTKMTGGCVAKTMYKIYSKDTGFEEFKLGIMECRERLDGRQIFQLVEDLLAVNISFLNDKGIQIKPYSEMKYQKTIMVVVSEDFTYSLLAKSKGDEIFTMFSRKK